MGKLDTIDKAYFEDAKRLAELLNVHLYHGESVVMPEELQITRRG